ncbi:hypothetical protein [Halobacteriovorax sp. JY17]|uniref:hypothetical protein n=1 Tax=Halobacteriovorax sp. JY17 TaxID=2014617 RepID=UPI000C4CE6B6|nr:hypothetical protein [Halobacteriovorax sp. JY17]PIK15620.1 MAG: hypothetical protein CES88_02530 [Halobacteriovorax sp. JY17]
MKFILFFLVSSSIFGQTVNDLRDMLNGKAFEQYEKMFEDMATELEALDKSQFEEYNKLFDQSIMRQLQIFGGVRRTYKWTESSSERILSFEGRLIEEENPKIEIKNDFFEIKGTFKKETNINGNKSISKSIQSVKISLPGDIDQSKVRYENLENSFKVIFPKKNITKKVSPPKKIRSPIKKNNSDITI